MGKETSEGKSASIRVCTCKNDYQDQKYGKGRRLMNFMKKTGGFRCTVCAKTYG
jgi:hypothetical protein